MKIYIAGPITGVIDYKRRFQAAERRLKRMGHTVINPALLPEGLGNTEDYMKICYPMIDSCDAVYVLDGWRESKGACLEVKHAEAESKKVYTSTLEIM